MKDNNRSYFLILVAFLLVIIIMLFFLFRCACCKKEPVVQQGGVISWNILFEKGTNQATREAVIKNIKKYVQDFYDEYNFNNHTNLAPMDHVSTCPCDTLLYNYDFLSIFGAGPSVTTAKSSQQTTANGNVLISSNIPINEPSPPRAFRPKEFSSTQYLTDSIQLYNKTIDTSRIIAIIDSGIDSSLFTPSISGLLWNDRVPLSTIFNFLPGQVESDKFDGTDSKHGSAVFSIIMKTLENSPAYPQVMILKALNENKTGSVFSVSCALSYAIQKKATLVNLSLGYEGGEDSILRRYISQTDTAGIELFMAAGNINRKHYPDSLCSPSVDGSLNNSRLFYPACFSTDYKNITSITQLNNTGQSCYYQNYSNQYITLGVLDTTKCCAVKVDLKSDSTYYEGSSFVTPIASGLRIGSILQSTNWNSLIKFNTQNVTVKGQYIFYSSNR